MVPCTFSCRNPEGEKTFQGRWGEKRRATPEHNRNTEMFVQQVLLHNNGSTSCPNKHCRHMASVYACPIMLPPENKQGPTQTDTRRHTKVTGATEKPIPCKYVLLPYVNQCIHQFRPGNVAVGQNQWHHFGVAAPPILVYFRGDLLMFTGVRFGF